MTDPSPARRASEPGTAKSGEHLFIVRLTEYEVDLIRQMVALDIHDWKSGSMPSDMRDPEFARRRVRDSEALLAKLDDLQK